MLIIIKLYFITIRMSGEENSILSDESIRNDENEGCKLPKSYVDQITLELLLNKSTYQKYLSKTDPDKHHQHQEFIKKLKGFKPNILDITEDMIDHQNHKYTNELTDAFDSYARAVIKYLEVESSKQQNDDEDVLFPPENIKYNFR